MKILSFSEQIYIKIEKPTIGVLQTTKDSSVECAEVLAVPNKSYKKDYNIKVGDKIFVKAWAIDTINYEDKVYNFVNVSSGGIMAIIK